MEMYMLSNLSLFWHTTWGKSRLWGGHPKEIVGNNASCLSIDVDNHLHASKFLVNSTRSNYACRCGICRWSSTYMYIIKMDIQANSKLFCQTVAISQHPSWLVWLASKHSQDSHSPPLSPSCSIGRRGYLPNLHKTPKQIYLYWAPSTSPIYKHHL